MVLSLHSSYELSDDSKLRLLQTQLIGVFVKWLVKR